METLMQPHDSMPYNPDTADVFYRAGFIENRGQGGQKICDECMALGAELPRYEIIGTGIRIYFTALKSALIEELKISNRQYGGIDGGLAEKIVELIRRDESITVFEISKKLETPKRTIEREMKRLREIKRIVREGGNRYGHWEVIE